MIRVATGGCFDILHAGHVDILQMARVLGDYLEVYLNTDDSVRRLKGKGRPIIPLAQRGLVLAGLSCVNNIYPFEEDTPCKIIQYRKPDRWVKGGDYKLEDLPEAEVVKSYGGEVVILPFRIDISTSKIIEKIKALDDKAKLHYSDNIIITRLGSEKHYHDDEYNHDVFFSISDYSSRVGDYREFNGKTINEIAEILKARIVEV